MRLLKISLLSALLGLSGCGEVVVFGNVVREGNTKTEVKEESATNTSSTTTSTVTTSASSSSQRSESTSPNSPVIPQTTSVRPFTPTAPTKAAPARSDLVGKAVRQVKSVTLSIAPELMDKTGADPRFDSKVLLETIKTELQTRKLVDTSDSQTGTTLSIYIDNYDLHATTNFTIFGAKPHTGTLAGNLMLSDEQGESTPIAHIEAYSRISIPEGGGDKSLLQPLYRDFAVIVANSLSGTQTPTSAERNQAPR